MALLTTLAHQLAQPPACYRAKPFWAWNGRLDPQELRRQIRTMKQMGLGGFFMHSRIGLDTPYLGDAWFDCVRACVEEARELGMEAWLYDEDRWPSGAAGGLVTAHPEFRMQRLICEVLPTTASFTWQEEIVAVFTARITGQQATEIQRLDARTTPTLPPGHQVLLFRQVPAPTSDWYNGQAYLDTMNPQAVARFIAVTHDAYRERFGPEFGRTIPGIFTDEPHHGSTFSPLLYTTQGDALPWTGGLLDAFEQRHGYALADHLPALFFTTEASEASRPSRTRRDYHDCITHRFTEAFARQIGQWCQGAGLQFTGHVLYESSLAYQAHAVGSAMRFYEHMQAPGMDLLTEYHREFDTAKQVASAARQFGRRFRLTETYGCTGWQFPLSGHKALGDWQLPMGINLRCQHLAWYTMAGEAKRDYPASILHQSPWWEVYAKVEDYFARINAVMDLGKERRDLLVIHPIESLWSIFGPDWKENATIARIEQTMTDLRDTLLGGNIDFDYGDEDILARHAAVVMQGDAPRFQVGEAIYTTILVPPLLTLRATTLALLRQFHERGGQVVFAGPVAEYLDAEVSDAVLAFAQHCGRCAAAGAGLVATVASCRLVSITDPQGQEIPDTLYLLREDEQAFYLFICNYGRDFTRPDPEVSTAERDHRFPEVRIRGLLHAREAIEIDAETGMCFSAHTTGTGDALTIHTSLEALGSRLFVLAKQPVEQAPPPRPRFKTVARQPLAPAQWAYTLSEPNNLVLDRPSLKLGDGPWQPPEEVLRVDQAIRDALGIPRRGEAMCQPWSQQDRAASHPAHPAGTIELTYTFAVETLPHGELFLAIERPELYAISLNGQTIRQDAEHGWWVDPSLKRLALAPDLLRPGRNELHLRSTYHDQHPGLEAIYLLGAFGARVQGTQITLVPLPATLALGDWTTQGLPFYSGAITYRTSFQATPQATHRTLLHLPAYAGTAARVHVNHQTAGVIAWQPNEIDLTDCLQEGENHLAIDIFAHRRNSHGPLHLAGHHPFIGPTQFLTSGEDWDDAYRLVACGLTAPPELLVQAPCHPAPESRPLSAEEAAGDLAAAAHR